MQLLHRSNVTGRWRGSNESQKIAVRNCQRALPAEIATGGTPEVFTIVSGRILCYNRI